MFNSKLNTVKKIINELADQSEEMTPNVMQQR